MNDLNQSDIETICKQLLDEFRGILSGPSGKEAEVVSVWIVLDGENILRFVTAFPGGK